MPGGAAKLGQKLCTKDGPIVYPKQVLPDETKWGPEMWNEKYRDDNPSANRYDTGTAPCKSKCEFDAIHLRRDHPEATKMIRSEDKKKTILPYIIKRAAKIKVKELRSKHS